MSARVLASLGMMRRANAIAVGETNAGAAVRAGKAKLLLLAEDASDNACRRAEGFVFGRGVPLCRIPFRKEEIAAAVGLSGCSMAAVTDLGFAAALTRQLAEQWPEDYMPLAKETQERLTREKQRRTDPARAKNKSIGKRRTNA